MKACSHLSFMWKINHSTEYVNQALSEVTCYQNEVDCCGPHEGQV